MTIKTPYGLATVAGRTQDGGLLLCLKKENMTTPPPNYRGGPCVFWIHKGAVG